MRLLSVILDNMSVKQKKHKHQQNKSDSTVIKNQSGFTLIELILYIAIVSIFITGAILFSWDVIYGRVKSQIQVDVNYNLRLASQRITKSIRQANGINAISPGYISLSNSNPTYNPTIIQLSNEQLFIGYGSSGDCNSSNPCPLTADNLKVSNLTFIDLSQTNSSNVQFSITIESESDRQEWQKSEIYSSSVELQGI